MEDPIRQREQGREYADAFAEQSAAGYAGMPEGERADRLERLRQRLEGRSEVSDGTRAGTTPDVEAAGVDALYTIGGGMAALREAVAPATRARHVPAAADLADDLTADLRDGDVVLFKGSNGTRVHALLAALLHKAEGA